MRLDEVDYEAEIERKRILREQIQQRRAQQKQGKNNLLNNILDTHFSLDGAGSGSEADDLFQPVLFGEKKRKRR